MTFEDYWNGLDQVLRDDIVLGWESCRLVFADTQHHWQFIINFGAESRLTGEAWEALCFVILDRLTNPSDLQRAFTGVFRSHTLGGDPVSSPAPAPLGRAVTLPLFMKLLKEQNVFSSDSEAEQLQNDLLDPSANADAVREALDGIFISRPRRAAWATFDVDQDRSPSGLDPFGSMALEADVIRARLGLSPNDKGKDLLLFVYELPSDMIARYPTIADAYAGDEWLYYFRPSPEGERWGVTMPWDGSGMAPCPEIVHTAVNASSLRDRIRVARG
jgi:hypothetical protein